MNPRLDIRVYYEDTDVAGIVYHANYLKFLERGRSEAVRAAGINQATLLRDEGIVFAVRSMTLEYLNAAKYDDILTVCSHIVQIGAASLRMSQTILRDEAPVFSASLRLVTLNSAGKPCKIPATTRQKLVTLLEK